MDSPKVITQRRLGTQVAYRFEDTSFKYTLKTLDFELAFSVKYEAVVALEPYEMSVTDKALLKRLAYIPALSLILYFALVAAQSSMVILAGIAMAVLVIAYTMATLLKLFSVRCTLLKMQPSPAGAGARPLMVMHTHNHDELLGEISQRWKASMRRLHSRVDVTSDPKRELARFKWLFENGVIDKDELDAALYEIKHAHPGALEYFHQAHN